MCPPNKMMEATGGRNHPVETTMLLKCCPKRCDVVKINIPIEAKSNQAPFSGMKNNSLVGRFDSKEKPDSASDVPRNGYDLRTSLAVGSVLRSGMKHLALRPQMSTVMAGQLTRGMLINEAKHYIKYPKK